MVRSLPWVVLLSVIAAPLFSFAEDAAPTVELKPYEIVGEAEKWPNMFEPETRIEPNLGPVETADRFAYRAAEYAVTASRYREHVVASSWPGRIVFGDGHFTRLFAGWVDELEDAAERSRTLSVRHHLSAYSAL